jgi:hypothetical protein
VQRLLCHKSSIISRLDRWTFRAARAEIAPTYAALVHAEQMTRREAQSAATHAVWERVAGTLGLGYDRV